MPSAPLADWIDLTAHICILGSFFLIAAEVASEDLVHEMRKRVVLGLVKPVNSLYAGVMVVKAEEADETGELTVSIEPVHWDKLWPMLRRWTVLLLPLGGSTRIMLSLAIGLAGALAVSFLWLFNRWASWEHELRGWAIALGVISFAYGSSAQIGLAAWRIW